MKYGIVKHDKRADAKNFTAIFHKFIIQIVSNYIPTVTSAIFIYLMVPTRLHEFKTFYYVMSKKRFSAWLFNSYLEACDRQTEVTVKQMLPSDITVSLDLLNIQKWSVVVVPVGKCSLIDQLSTCRVALPPFLVNRTTWYFPSFTGVLLSCTLMSSVPMLKVTPIFPCCCNDKTFAVIKCPCSTELLFWCLFEYPALKISRARQL